MSKKVRFTATRISQFECPPDKQQSFIWDSNTQGLGLRKTPRGSPSYIFQSRFNGKSIRISIGSPKVWSIGDAQQKARELQRQIDQGQDPRQIRAKLQAKQQRDQTEKKLKSATFGEVFSEYIEHRKDSWGERHYLDHVGMVASGKRGKAGVLRPFVERTLCEIDSEAVEELMNTESSLRPARARLALRHLRAFFTWASEHKMWKQVVQSNAASSRELRRLVGTGKPRTDYIEKGQLKAWLLACDNYPNEVIAAYLQVLLLTGARREELACVRWDDIDFRWETLRLKDKNEGLRTIPMTPGIKRLISPLPRRNEWVFSSVRSKSGRLVEPSQALRKINKDIGIRVSIHGLRRSFKSLSEWLDVPVGVVAQIMGHKPSALVEKHYTQRPIDLLRIHHIKIERWIMSGGDGSNNVQVINESKTPEQKIIKKYDFDLLKIS